MKERTDIQWRVSAHDDALDTFRLDGIGTTPEEAREELLDRLEEIEQSNIAKNAGVSRIRIALNAAEEQ